MSEYGTMESPLEDCKPMTLAKAMLADRFQTEDGLRTLHEYRQLFWAWEGGRWEVERNRWLEDEVIRWLDGKWYVRVKKAMGGANAQEEEEVTEVPVRVGLATEVVRLMQTQIWLKRLERTPVWVSVDEPCPVTIGSTVAFKDVLVDCKAGTVVERDERWFDNALNVAFRSLRRRGTPYTPAVFSRSTCAGSSSRAKPPRFSFS